MTSTLLVSGGCDGDIRIWNAQKGAERTGFNVTYFLSNANTLCRKVHQNNTRAFGLRDCRPLQSRCRTHRIVCIRRPYVSFVKRTHNPGSSHRCSRIWNTSTGQCLKTLTEGQDAIWYASSASWLFRIAHTHTANTYNSLRTQSTFYPLRTTVLSVYGITIRPVV